MKRNLTNSKVKEAKGRNKYRGRGKGVMDEVDR